MEGVWGNLFSSRKVPPLREEEACKTVAAASGACTEREWSVCRKKLVARGGGGSGWGMEAWGVRRRRRGAADGHEPGDYGL